MESKDLKKLTTLELLEIYNTHAKKSITRFSDRKAALRRTATLLKELQTQTKPKIDAPTPGSLVNAHRKSKSAVIAARKTSPTSTKEYPSILSAFKALDLPIGVHKTFRRKLKLAGTAEIDGVVFTATYKD